MIEHQADEPQPQQLPLPHIPEEQDDNDSQAEIDRMMINFPLRGGIGVYGKNASKAYFGLIIIGIILALGFTVPRIIEAFRNATTPSPAGSPIDSVLWWDNRHPTRVSRSPHWTTGKA